MAFRYYNANPQGDNEQDCVIRAISLALQTSYYDIITMLRANGRFYECDDLCVSCYERLLDRKFNLPHYISYGKTAKQIANEHPRDRVILRMEGHLSCSLYGDIYDTWDCSNEECTDYWIVK